MCRGRLVFSPFSFFSFFLFFLPDWTATGEIRRREQGLGAKRLLFFAAPRESCLAAGMDESYSFPPFLTLFSSLFFSFFRLSRFFPPAYAKTCRTGEADATESMIDPFPSFSSLLFFPFLFFFPFPPGRATLGATAGKWPKRE